MTCGSAFEPFGGSWATLVIAIVDRAIATAADEARAEKRLRIVMSLAVGVDRVRERTGPRGIAWTDLSRDARQDVTSGLDQERGVQQEQRR